MGWFSALVVLAMVWSMVMLVLLQTGLTTQGDRGARLHGTHASAPEGFRLKPRLWLATAIALPIWALLVWLITSGLVTIDTLRWLTGQEGRFGG
jgi:predicted secreted protein